MVQHYLHQIESKKHLNAFVEIFAEEALQKAAALDNSLQQGETMAPLHGVVVSIKDVICYKGHTVTAASHILKNFKSTYSATAVEKLLKAGAIIIGNCNCDEFAMGSSNENSVYGPVLNDLDNTRVPGGSSGGSAVAVQAGMCMVSLGSDTGGSVRQPADFCGIVGMKPTYGRISRYGLIAYASSFDQIGILANNIEDVAKVLQVISGKDEMDSTSSSIAVPDYAKLLPSANNKKYRFAYLDSTLKLPGLDPYIKSTIESFFEQLHSEGHTVEAMPFSLLKYLIPTYYVLTTAEASSNLSRFDGIRFGSGGGNVKLELTDYYKKVRTEGFGKEVKRRIMLGSFVLSAGYYDAYFTKAQKLRRLIFNQIDSIFKDFDAILAPVSPITAFKIGEPPIQSYLSDIYTVFANLTGIPAISLPLFKHSNGLPFGLQALTNRFEEVSLFQISSSLNQSALYYNRRTEEILDSSSFIK